MDAAGDAILFPLSGTTDTAPIREGTMALIWMVEDDPKISLLIEMTLKKAEHRPVRFADAKEMEAALAKRQPLPRLLLLDLMLREKNGFVILKDWKQRRITTDIPVIILSARGSERDKVMGLELGAEDYIVKPFGVRELQARVKAALRRLPKENQKISLGSLTLMPQSQEIFIDGKRVSLTAKEYELLHYLALKHQTVVTRAELLREVWGYETKNDPSRTVDSHIKTLRTKLGDEAAEPRFIRTVRGTGYRLIAGEEKKADGRREG